MLKKKVLYKLFKVTVAVAFASLTVVSILTGNSLYFNNKGDRRFLVNGILKNRKLNITEPYILVNLHDFNDKEKLIVKDSIRKIDELSDNINYVFSDEQYIQTKQVIDIYNNVEFSDESTAGMVKIINTLFTENMNFPLEIKLRKNLINQVYQQDHNVTLLSYVVTHEMLHTLGFNDLKTDEWLGKSIMYYNADIASDYGVASLTEKDKEDIIEIYGGTEKDN